MRGHGEWRCAGEKGLGMGVEVRVGEEGWWRVRGGRVGEGGMVVETAEHVQAVSLSILPHPGMSTSSLEFWAGTFSDMFPRPGIFTK